MEARGGKRAAAAAGAVAALVLIAGALSWREVAAEWHLRKLRSDPAYIGSIVEREAGSPAGIAVRRYARSEAGASAVAELFLRALIDEEIEEEEYRRLGVRPPALPMWMASFPSPSQEPALEIQVIQVLHPSGMGNRLYTGKRLPVLQEILVASGTRKPMEFALAEHPDWSFKVLPGDLTFLAGAAPWFGPILTASQWAVLGRKAGSEIPMLVPCALPLIVRAAGGEEFEARRISRETLRKQGIDPEDPVPGLVEHLRKEPEVRCHCFVHPDSPEHPWLKVRPPVIEHLGFGVRRIHPVARALIDLGPGVLPKLTACLLAVRLPDSASVDAIMVYRKFGNASIPYLEELSSPESTVSVTLNMRARESLGHVRIADGEDLVPLLEP